MTYCFDIDGTLCTNTYGEYQDAQPFPEVIARVNELFAAGHRILLYTDDGDAALSEVARMGHVAQSTLVRRSTLEDVFLRLTGRSLVD